MIDKDAELIREIRRHLDAESVALDGATCSQLTQARCAAVDAAKRSRYHWLPRLLASTATAAVLGLAVMVGVHFHARNSMPASVPMELNVVADAQDMELVEDLDFYVWLEEEMDAG